MTQGERILRHLQQYGSITSLECVTEYGIIDGRKRISELRAAGWPIVSTPGKSKNRYGEDVTYNIYRLEH